MTAYAVVELFTSEGCSSCPPADEVLAELAARRERGDAVFTLGFHVDYWDYIGWRDPFGGPGCTHRQRAYASVLRTRGLYTPQVVINGATDLVGSQRRRVHKAVDAALRTDGLEITIAATASGTVVDIAATVDAAPAGTLLTAVLTSRYGRSEVTRGENAGRTLPHVDVVRATDVVPGNGVLQLAVPTEAAIDELSVTVLAQDPRTMHVRGASRVPVAPAPGLRPR